MNISQSWLLPARRLCVDVLVCGLAYCAIVILPLLALGFSLPELYGTGALLNLAVYCGVALVSLVLLRVPRMIWRYVSFRDLMRLTRAVSLMVVVFSVINLLTSPQWPGFGTLWLPATLWLFTLIFLAAPRALARAMGEGPSAPFQRSAIQERRMDVLLTGDVNRMEAFMREAIRNPRSEYNVVGIFCDNTQLHGGHMHGVPVIGAVKNIAKSLSSLRRNGVFPKMLVLASENPERSEFERLLDLVSGLDIKVGQIPAQRATQGGGPVLPVVIADLLGRPEIRLDSAPLESMIRGQRILITGAGGSIGSELSRQVAALTPAEIVLADSCEYNLYRIEKEFQEKFPDVRQQTALMDVRDTALVLQWVRKFRPDIVFHAAALKHVPLLEDHPIEAVKTNVLGTVNVADACYTCGVPLMVTISTDKAVNPFNVMGATKRLAEAYCQGVDQSHSAAITRYVTVRFGNVLGSAGSVVPLFQRQIEEGGPVTVTHPDITRYFMTIPEAVALVLQASAQGKVDQGDRGSIYVLDMGKPIKIMDLARQMVRLSGKRPDVDIDIKVVGLRPGEKLYEEVVHAEEGVTQTRNSSVFKVTPRVTDLRIIQQQIQELRLAVAASDAERVPRLLTIAVPEYGEILKRQAQQRAQQQV
jgi:O-antigen biosynthesis protein WbqV